MTGIMLGRFICKLCKFNLLCAPTILFNIKGNLNGDDGTYKKKFKHKLDKRNNDEGDGNDLLMILNDMIIT